jgi:Amt family ammonium transporter
MDQERQTDHAGRSFGCCCRSGRDHTGLRFCNTASRRGHRLLAGVVCYSACFLKGIFGYDDSLDVVGVHGVGGILGAILTGVFASKAINPAGNDGLIYGNPGLVVTQSIAVVCTIVFVTVGTGVILLVLKAVMGLRVSEEEELMGLDLSQHTESAYALASDYDEGASALSDHGSPIAKTATSKA